MVKYRLKIVLVALFVLFVIWLTFWTFQFNSLSTSQNVFNSSISILSPARIASVTPTVDPNLVHIAVVSCGKDRAIESLNMIKSAITFNQKRARLKFIVVTEDELMQLYREKLDDWREINDNIFTYELLPLTFPELNREEWKKLFKKCAAQRLFLPSLLKNTDSILYLDSDTLFLSSPDEIWAMFRKFNASQVAACAPEHENSQMGWYNRFAKHPYYGALGVNSGVMLMNLTRLRDLQWEETILSIYKEYKRNLVWGDQDLINILFNFHSDKLYVFGCEWNYRADHCMYMSVCKTLDDGVKILHGNRHYFHSNAQPIFKTIYQAIEEYRFQTNPYANIVEKIELNLDIPSKLNCDKLIEEFLKSPKQLLKDIDYKNSDYGNY